MKLKLGNITLAGGSDTSTFLIECPSLELGRNLENIDIIGSDFSNNFDTKNISFEFEILVQRQFLNSSEAFIFNFKHIKILQNIDCGILEIEDFAGAKITFENAFLQGFSVKEQTGNTAIYSYIFKTGRLLKCSQI